MRQYLPELIDLIWNRKINPGKVFDLTLPLEQVAEGYRAMDERRAIKALLLAITPCKTTNSVDHSTKTITKTENQQ